MSPEVVVFIIAMVALIAALAAAVLAGNVAGTVATLRSSQRRERETLQLQVHTWHDQQRTRLLELHAATDSLLQEARGVLEEAKPATHNQAVLAQAVKDLETQVQDLASALSMMKGFR